MILNRKNIAVLRFTNIIPGGFVRINMFDHIVCKRDNADVSIQVQKCVSLEYMNIVQSY